MYDELVKKIRHCATDPMHCLSCGEDKDGRCFKRLMTQAADALEELTALSRRQEVELVELTGELASKPRWIPVTEALPEERDNYLVLTEELENYVCDFIPSMKQWWTVPGDTFLIDVTHWMPLPEPPEDKNDA